MPREAASATAAVAAGGCLLATAGMGARRAEAAAERLVARGAAALLSWGTAGGLDPALAPGTLVVPDRIRAATADFASDRAWSARLRTQLGALDARDGNACCTERAVVTAVDKQALYRDHGCAIVDMESAAIAAIAVRHGLPFAAVRCVVDPADFTLPRTVLAAMEPAGDASVWRVLTGLVRRPWDLAAVLRLARWYGISLVQLRLAADVLGADLACAEYTAQASK